MAAAKHLLNLQGWQMSVPNHKDGNAAVLDEVRPSVNGEGYDPRNPNGVYDQVGASFHSPDDEHYYGLGQNQEGWLDHRGPSGALLERLPGDGGAELLRAVSGDEQGLRGAVG